MFFVFFFVFFVLFFFDSVLRRRGQEGRKEGRNGAWSLLYLCLYLSVSIYIYLYLYLNIYIYISLSIYLKGLHYHRDDVQPPSQP